MAARKSKAEQEKDRAERRALVLKEKRRDVARKLKPALSAMAGSFAAKLDPDRIYGIMQTAMSRRPELLECSPASIVRGCLEAAQLGLVVESPLREASLVPRRSKHDGEKHAELIIEYQGLTKLVRRAGQVRDIEAVLVHAKDVFKMTRGTNPQLIHEPSLDPDPGDIVRVYGLAWFHDGTSKFDWMSIEEVNAIRDQVPSWQKTPWGNPVGYGEMVKKTMVRRMTKMLDKSRDVAAAVAKMDAHDRGDFVRLADLDPDYGEATPVEDDPEAGKGGQEPPKAEVLDDQPMDELLKALKEKVELQDGELEQIDAALESGDMPSIEMWAKELSGRPGADGELPL